MRALAKLRLRFRSLFQRGQVERELEAELRFHLDQLIATHTAAGLSPEQARAAALREMGGMAQIEEACRDTRRVALFEDLGKDLRHAVRVLRRSPGFTAVAVLTLALGIGATTAIFSVVHGVLLKPLPFSEPERLVGVWHRGYNQGPGTFFTYRDGQQVFEDLAAWETDQVSVTGGGEPEQVEALSVTEALLPLLRVRPALGRLFEPADDRAQGPRRVMLTHGYWQRRFGGAREVVGTLLPIDGRPAEIVGVLPPSFRFLRADPAVLMPMQLDRADADDGSFDFQALARLRPGVTMAQAEADLVRLTAALPGSYARYRLQPQVRPLLDDVTGGVGRVLWILLGTVGLVLLIACANVANLFLVRAETRQQELAVRAALGASRGRIARQLLTESLLLGLAGGVVGLAIAGAGLVVLRRLAPAALPRLHEIGLDPAVLIFTLVTSVLAGIFFGLIPILRRRGEQVLEPEGRTTTDGRRQRTRQALVVAEVAMALVLLIVSGLMIRTFVALRQVRPGFARAAEVQTFRVAIPPGMVGEGRQMAETHERIVRRLQQVPGVTSVGLASSITLDGEDNLNPVFIEHLHAPYDRQPPFRRLKSVAPGYFETMGNPVLAGRAIDWSDIYQVRPVVVVSARLAREHWGEPAAALGKRLRHDATWHEIVGVVGDEHDDGLDRPTTAMVYWPMLSPSYSRRTMAYAVRSPRAGTPGFLGELRQAVWSVNGSLPLASVRTLDQIQAASMARTAFALVMLAIAASVALLLGLVGIYGVIAYVVAQRTREIGIRMALGARTGDVRRLFLRQGAVLAGIGIALGLLISAALTRVMSSLLFGVAATDPPTYLAVSAGLGAVALLATWIPARRASRVPPMVALRAIS